MIPATIPMGPPSCRFLIVHSTGFRYAEPVAASYNEARMTPVTTARQTVLDARVEVRPVTWTHTYWDYWGSQVTAFDVLTPHEELAVVSTATVELFDSEEPAPRVGWTELADEQTRDQHHEFLQQTACTRPPEEVVSLARDLASELDPAQAAAAVGERIRGLVDYVPGATSVQSNAIDAWTARKGVCQDFAHLTLGALREIGIPCRYVSGYLHPRPDAALGETVAGQSHAWVEWWVGDWVPYDPTHTTLVGPHHVLVAHGRDYTDVTPLKGVYAGGSSSELFVSVEVTRLA